MSFNSDNGQLNIGVRRGGGSTGVRNPFESLTLSIKDIPNGFALAKKVGNQFKAVGASDAFGTISLFTIDKSNSIGGSNHINDFNQIQSGNLYLVAKDNSVLNSEAFGKLTGKSLNLSLVSRITDQPGGDSRSESINQKIALSNFSGDVPILSPLVVDPLIIDLDSNGLSLISLSEASNKDITFEMYPKGGKVITSWLGNDDNQAFVVLNDSSNDSIQSEIEIKSISEIFSEYFQARSDKRTFNSELQHWLV